MTHCRVLDDASFDRLTAGATVLGSDESGVVNLGLADGGRLELRPTGILPRLIRIFGHSQNRPHSGLIAAYRFWNLRPSISEPTSFPRVPAIPPGLTSSSGDDVTLGFAGSDGKTAENV